MFTENTSVFIKEEKTGDFVCNCHRFGFVQFGELFLLRKNLSKADEELYILFTVNIRIRKVYMEMHVSKAYWIEFGMDTFEPLWELYRQGYIEIV